MNAGKKSGFPKVRPGTGSVAGEENDVSGEILRFTAESVGTPGSDRGIALAIESGVKDELSRAMIELGRVDRLHQTKIVGDTTEVREQFGKCETALAVLGKLIGRAKELRMTAEEGEAFPFEEFLRRKLAIVLPEDRLLIKQIELRGSPRHVEKNDTLRLRRDRPKRLRHRRHSVLLKQRAKRERTNSSPCAGKKVSAIESHVPIHPQKC